MICKEVIWNEFYQWGYTGINKHTKSLERYFVMMIEKELEKFKKMKTLEVKQIILFLLYQCGYTGKKNQKKN